MTTIKIKRGLDLPLAGGPPQQIAARIDPKRVALLGPDYLQLKPTMQIAEGDTVTQGQPLFTDKKNPGVNFTAPAPGRILRIHRGPRRVLESVVIEVDPTGQKRPFTAHAPAALDHLDRKTIIAQLTESGQWTALRTRPYSKIPRPDSPPPAAIFITAIDTNPLAPDPTLAITEHPAAFQAGLRTLARLTDGPLYLCHATADLPDLPDLPNLKTQQFSGPHPAGNAGVHIHHLRPASLKNPVWTIGYQDVIATGHLFTQGHLFTERIIAIAGPQIKIPKIVRTNLGTPLADLTADNLKPGDNRLITGSVLNGRTAAGPTAYLGRYHNQITALKEGHERPLLHYLSPGRDRFSALPIYLSRLTPTKLWNFTTTTNGSERAMVPIGAYEQIMPGDYLPTQLLRALIVGDTATAQQLGALELDEEDLALCTFVCPGKYDYGPILRTNLDRIEKDG